MSTFGDDLVQSLREALAHAKGDGPAIVHPAVSPREVREAINLTQAADGAPGGHEPVATGGGSRAQARQRTGAALLQANPPGATRDSVPTPL